MTWTNICRAAFALAALILPSGAAHAGQIIRNDHGRCQAGNTAVLATVYGIKDLQGNIRVQSYRATNSEWLQKGHWLSRIDVPATAGVMRFCIPVETAGAYAIAVRHDRNGNGKTDIMRDGGGMSNNPAISIWNLGKPSYNKVRVIVDGVTQITIRMRYM